MGNYKSGAAQTDSAEGPCGLGGLWVSAPPGGTPPSETAVNSGHAALNQKFVHQRLRFQEVNICVSDSNEDFDP